MKLKYKSLFIIFLSCFNLTLAQTEAVLNKGLDDEASESLENLGMDVNSSYSELNPLISPDGNTLFFSRKDHPQNLGEDNQSDIWIVYKDINTWSSAINLGAPLNTKEPNQVIGINLTGDVLYLKGNYNDRSTTGISFSIKQGRTWSAPKPLTIKKFYNYSNDVNYFVSSDGNILLMSAQREDSKGDRDLYVSFREDVNTWGEPSNLGSRINTNGIEANVFLASDGKTIYYSSDGLIGEGGLDIWMSRRLDDTWTRWSEPVNMGKSINTKADELWCSVPAIGSYAYIVNDSKNSFGGTDIYQVQIPESFRPAPVAYIKGKVVDAINKNNIKTKIKFQNLKPEFKSKVFQTKDDGEYAILLPIGTDIGISTNVQGFFSVADYIPLSNEKLETIDFEGNAEAALYTGVLPFRSNDVETERLQLRLNELDKEIYDIELQRDNNQFLIIPKSKQIPVPPKDKELEKLKNQYNKVLEPETSPDKAIEIKKDRQLEAMRLKYRRYYEAQEGVAMPDEDNNAQPADEVKRLKQQYNRAHNLPEAEPKPTPVAPTIPDKEKEEYIALIRKEMESEWASKIRRELQDAMIDDVKEEVEKDLDDNGKKMLNASLKSKVLDQLHARSEAAIRQEFEDSDHRENKTSPFEAEIRQMLREEVRNELLSVMKEPVKQEIRLEMKYLLKKELRIQLYQELERKVQKQVKQEKEKPLSTEPIEFKNKQTFQLKPINSIPLEYVEMECNVNLYPIKAGQNIPLKNIFFESNNDVLKEESYPELDRIVAFLKEYYNVVVEIGTHTNGTVSHEFANNITTKRAQAIANYLVSKGSQAGHIKPKGYGKTMPIMSNETLEGRRQNQRIEMRIMEMVH